MHDRGFDQSLKMRLLGWVAPTDEGSPAGQHQLEWIEGEFLHPIGNSRSLIVQGRSGGRLTSGQTVGAVVMHQNGYIAVAFGGKDEMIQTFGVAVSITHETDNLKVG